MFGHNHLMKAASVFTDAYGTNDVGIHGLSVITQPAYFKPDNLSKYSNKPIIG